MGADRAIHVELNPAAYQKLQSFHVSKILAKLAVEEKADLVIVGKQVCLFVVQLDQFSEHVINREDEISDTY